MGPGQLMREQVTLYYSPPCSDVRFTAPLGREGIWVPTGCVARCPTVSWGASGRLGGGCLLCWEALAGSPRWRHDSLTWNCEELLMCQMAESKIKGRSEEGKMP